MTFVFTSNTSYGIYHLLNKNSCSWYEFAKDILIDTEVQAIPIVSEEYPQKATRPQYAVMDLSKAESLELVITTGEEALAVLLNSIVRK